MLWIWLSFTGAILWATCRIGMISYVLVAKEPVRSRWPEMKFGEKLIVIGNYVGPVIMLAGFTGVIIGIILGK